MTQSLVENLQRSAARYVDRCAIEAGDACIDYGTLWRRVVAAADFLARQGLAPGDRVAIALPNNIEYVVAYYGALLAGAVAVPLNTAAKAHDLATWIEHSQARWLLGDARNPEVRGSLERLAAPPTVVLAGEANGAIPSFEQISTPGEATSGFQAPAHDRPATILYTSGTTGRPKGVLLSHSNLGSNAESIATYLQLTEQDSIVTFLPFYYSYGSSVLHSHLRVGARLTLEPNFVYPHAVVGSLANKRATGFAGVPSTFALMLSRVKLDQYDLSSLRYVTQAGGPMSQALTEKLCAALPRTDVIVMYGQTEATARLTYLPPADLRRKIGSVGIPIPGVEIEVRTERGIKAAVDEVGEVWARGPNIMLGYWRDEETTRSVLRDGWLKTGDMGYLDSDGYLYLKGRRSDIIKVGAHRIHPKEVEEVVAEFPGVQEVAAVGVDDEMLGQVIKVFVVPAPESNVTALQIQGHCRGRLANYKVPKFVEFVSSLPKTASGKVLRAQLTKGV